jgi:hypothetical protein
MAESRHTDRVGYAVCEGQQQQQSTNSDTGEATAMVSSMPT